MSTPLVSIIVPTKNNERTIDLLMKSLQRQCVKMEVIVVDFSTDRTPEIVMKYDFVKLIRVRRPGLNLARNIGVSVAKGDIVAITDGDCEVPSDWLRNILIEHRRFPEAVCIGGSVLVSDNLKESVIACYYSESIWPIMPTYKRNIRLSKNNFHKIRVPSGNNISFKREIFNKYSFDEEFIGGYDEVDLLWKICSDDLYIFTSPRIVVYHHHGKDLKSLLRRAYNYGRGHLLFFIKHPRCPLALIPILVVLVLLPVLLLILGLSIQYLGIVLGMAITYCSLLILYAKRRYCRKKVLLYPLLDILFYTTFAIGIWIELLKRGFHRIRSLLSFE